MSQVQIELENALATYRTRMSQSNRAFWTAKIHSLEQDPSLTDRKRLNILVRYFRSGPGWAKTGHGSSITRPSEILIPPGQPGHVDLGIDTDGTIPPAPEASVKTFLEKLTDRLNEVSSDERLEVPEEYRHLLKFTDAISDVDFRRSEEAGLDGVCGGIPSRHNLSDMAPGGRPWELDGWTIYGGWRTGLGDEKATHLLYGRKESGTPEEQQLAWRLCAKDGHEDHETRWFPSIAAFLLFRAGWLERLPQGWENVHPEPEDSEEDDDSETDDDAESSDISDEDDDSDTDDDSSPYQAFDCIHEVLPGDQLDTTGLSEPISDLSLEDRVSKAVKDFETKQEDSNLQWLHARLRKIEETATSDPTESQESRERLAGSFGFSSWSSLASEHKLSVPRDLLSVWPEISRRFPCTSPPVPKEDRAAFLQSLSVDINQVYDPDHPNFYVVPLPEDYELLLRVTDGIRDNDLRGEGVCGATGVRGADVPTMAPDETEKLPWVYGLRRLGWEVSTGFVLGKGKKPNDQWLVYYYCERLEITSSGPRVFKKDEIKDSERELRWRVFYKEPDRFCTTFCWPKIFDDIAEWLQYYQGWWDRELKVYPGMAARKKEEDKERWKITKLMYPLEKKKAKRVKLDTEGEKAGDLLESSSQDGVLSGTGWFD